MRWVLASAALLCLSFSGCGAPEIPGEGGDDAPARAAPENDREAELREAAEKAPYLVGEAPPPSREVDEAAREDADRASGHVYLNYSGGGGEAPVEEPVILIREEPDPSSDVVATFSMDGTGTDPVVRAGEAGLKEGAPRSGPDARGLPVAQVDGGWARIIYAYEADGASRSGWVNLERPEARLRTYEEEVQDGVVWLRDPDAATFREEPEGPPVQVPLTVEGEAPGERVVDYVLRVQEVREDRVRVEVTIPNVSPCTGDPYAEVVMQEELWLPLRDSEGRRTLGQAVEGC